VTLRDMGTKLKQLRESILQNFPNANNFKDVQKSFWKSHLEINATSV
jgi:hypothetical protein